MANKGVCLFVCVSEGDKVGRKPSMQEENWILHVVGKSSLLLREVAEWKVVGDRSK